MPLHSRLKLQKGNESVEHRKAEVELVNARVTKTKKEIEELKAQLQQLISDGIKKTDFTETRQNIVALNDEYKSVTYNEQSLISKKSDNIVPSEAHINKVKSFKDNVADIIANGNEMETFRYSTSTQKSKLDAQDELCKKVRIHDKESTRKYMEKQKLRRKQLLNEQKNEIAGFQQIKKQRLEELRKKSQELLLKNVEKIRKRSNQKEDKNCINQENARNLSFITIRNESNSDYFPVSQDKIYKFSHPELRNITFRSPNTDFVNAMTILNEAKHDLQREKAAIKIQSAFRCYRQRKIFLLNRKLKIEKEVQTQEIVPIWLQQPTAMPYPYNFIDAVKKKLNLAVQQINNYNTESIVNISNTESSKKSISHDKSSSLKENEQPVQKPLSSFLSQKCLNLDTKNVEPLGLSAKSLTLDLKNIKHKSGVGGDIMTQQNSDLQKLQCNRNITNGNQQNSDSDTSKNIPDLSSENSIKHSSKRPHSSDTEDQKFHINIERVKKMKLHQPKRLNFDVTDNLNVTNGIIPNKDLEPDFLQMGSNCLSSGKESIISSNRCDYISNRRNSKFLEINKDNSIKSHSQKSHVSDQSNTEILTKASKSNSTQEESKKSKSANLTKHIEVSKSRIRRTSSQENIINIIDEKLSKGDIQEENVKSVSSILSKHSEVSKNRIGKKSGQENTINTFDEKLIVGDIQENVKSISSILNRHSDTAQTSVSKESIETKPNITTSKDGDYSSNFLSVSSTSSLPLLKHPTVSLKSSRTSLNNLKDSEDESIDKTVTNIVLRDGEKTKTRIKTNEIHLKFEAELHLLNDFNDSLRQVMAVEKSLLDLHDKNNKTKENKDEAQLFYTRDTQTSIKTKSATDTKNTNNNNTDLIPTISYTRGSEALEQLEHTGNFESEVTDMNESSLFISGMELSHLKDSTLSSLEPSNINISVRGDYSDRSIMKEIPLEMFDQLIQDEDIRIENLKTILKIREKSLVDRTKGELAWLEIQKKQLKDSGQLQQISAIKKKQRGLLIKLEHERHEMQRLKQMQKLASKKRKSVLKEKRNMIKIQLSASNVITKIKRNAKEERRSTGPLKVYNIKSHSESVRSETSFSRKSSITEEIISVVSQSKSIVSHVNEDLGFTENQLVAGNQVATLIDSRKSLIEAEHIRRSLLMREEVLHKRRQAAEELLQWHQRLIDEEKKIAELESAANAIISQTPSSVAVATTINSDNNNKQDKHKFKGSQLNLLWNKIAGQEDNKFNDKLTYSMSKESFEQFCHDAKKASKMHQRKSLNKNRENHTHLDGESVSIKESMQYKSDNNIIVESDYTLEFDSSSSITDELQSNKSVLSNNEINKENSDRDNADVSEKTVKYSGIENSSVLTNKLSEPASVTNHITHKSGYSQQSDQKHSEILSESNAESSFISPFKSNKTETNKEIDSTTEITSESQYSSNLNKSRGKESSEISEEYNTEIASQSNKKSNSEMVLVSKNVHSKVESDKNSLRSLESTIAFTVEDSTKTKLKTSPSKITSEYQTDTDSYKNDNSTFISEELSVDDEIIDKTSSKSKNIETNRHSRISNVITTDSENSEILSEKQIGTDMVKENINISNMYSELSENITKNQLTDSDKNKSIQENINISNMYSELSENITKNQLTDSDKNKSIQENVNISNMYSELSENITKNQLTDSDENKSIAIYTQSEKIKSSTDTDSDKNFSINIQTEKSENKFEFDSSKENSNIINTQTENLEKEISNVVSKQSEESIISSEHLSFVSGSSSKATKSTSTTSTETSSKKIATEKSQSEIDKNSQDKNVSESDYIESFNHSVDQNISYINNENSEIVLEKSANVHSTKNNSLQEVTDNFNDLSNLNTEKSEIVPKIIEVVEEKSTKSNSFDEENISSHIETKIEDEINLLDAELSNGKNIYSKELNVEKIQSESSFETESTNSKSSINSKIFSNASVEDEISESNVEIGSRKSLEAQISSKNIDSAYRNKVELSNDSEMDVSNSTDSDSSITETNEQIYSTQKDSILKEENKSSRILTKHHTLSKKKDQKTKSTDGQISPKDSSLHDVESLEKSYSVKFDNLVELNEKEAVPAISEAVEKNLEVDDNTDMSKNENTLQLENDESISSSSATDKTYSPLLLSYGFIETKDKKGENTSESITDDLTDEESKSVLVESERSNLHDNFIPDEKKENKLKIKNNFSGNEIKSALFEPDELNKRNLILADNLENIKDDFSDNRNNPDVIEKSKLHESLMQEDTLKSIQDNFSDEDSKLPIFNFEECKLLGNIIQNDKIEDTLESIKDKFSIEDHVSVSSKLKEVETNKLYEQEESKDDMLESVKDFSNEGSISIKSTESKKLQESVMEDKIKENASKCINIEEDFSKEKSNSVQSELNETNKNSLVCDIFQEEIKENIMESTTMKYESNNKVDECEIFQSDESGGKYKEELKNEDYIENEKDDKIKIVEDSKIFKCEAEHIDVKKRVSEILADANIANTNKTPKLQNLYITAYDITSPDHSPESDSPVEETIPNFSPLPRVYGNDEVEELFKKQLAIEQEIKEIQQQQKEHLPYVYVREIPNKPPPPYKPPLISQVPVAESVIPFGDNQIKAITKLSTDLLYDAYLHKKIDTVCLTEDIKLLLYKKHKIDHSCAEFVFDLCKEAAIEHYKQFLSNEGPSWMHLSKKNKLAIDDPLSKSSLEKSLNKTINHWLGHGIIKSVENNKHKWSGKKRDHVDDLLVIECQVEEAEWINYDQDELVVKDELTKNIMDMLIDETAQLINNILIKKESLC